MSTKPLRRAVLPAAGFGTRMLPAARAVPKELLPILDRPTIQYVVEEAAAAGITDVTLVTSPLKPALLAHFDGDPNDPLRQRLNASGKGAMLKSVDDLIARVRIGAVMQHEQRGLGHAVMVARDAIGDEPFACMLADTVFAGPVPPMVQLAEAHRRLGTAVIGLERVSPDKVGRYGIVGGTESDDGTIRITTLVEKPRPADAPSNLAIAARYILTPALFDCLDQVRPGVGGEVQLTDALRLLCDREPVHGVVLTARRHDIGNPVDWLAANLAFAAAEPALWAKLAPAVRELLATVV
jgi:UTP--glucose-1-phosphate uridylyltransferase